MQRISDQEASTLTDVIDAFEQLANKHPSDYRLHIQHIISLTKLSQHGLSSDRAASINQLHLILTTTLAINPLVLQDLLEIQAMCHLLSNQYCPHEIMHPVFLSLIVFFSDHTDYDFLLEFHKTLNIIKHELSYADRCYLMPILISALKILLYTYQQQILLDGPVKQSLMTKEAYFVKLIEILENTQTTEAECVPLDDDSVIYSNLHKKAVQLIANANENQADIDFLKRQRIEKPSSHPSSPMKSPPNSPKKRLFGQTAHPENPDSKKPRTLKF